MLGHWVQSRRVVPPSSPSPIDRVWDRVQAGCSDLNPRIADDRVLQQLPEYVLVPRFDEEAIVFQHDLGFAEGVGAAAYVLYHLKGTMRERLDEIEMR